MCSSDLYRADIGGGMLAPGPRQVREQFRGEERVLRQARGKFMDIEFVVARAEAIDDCLGFRQDRQGTLRDLEHPILNARGPARVIFNRVLHKRISAMRAKTKVFALTFPVLLPNRFKSRRFEAFLSKKDPYESVDTVR